MQLDLDSEELQRSVNAAASKAISTALEGSATQAAIARVVGEAFVENVLAVSVREAVSGVDTARLTAAIAQELQRTAVKVVTKIMHEGLVDLVCKMRGIGHYSKEDQAARARLLAEIGRT